MAQAGDRLCQRVREAPWYPTARRVALFAAIRNEPDLRAVLEDCLRRGVCVAYPRAAAGELAFTVVRAASDLAPGAFGIPEPPAGGEVVAPADLDVVLMPGLVFDLGGGRLGYGKGFYDRTLGGADRSAGGPLRIGIAWDLQVLPADRTVPTRPHDVRLHGLVTDQRSIRFGKEAP